MKYVIPPPRYYSNVSNEKLLQDMRLTAKKLKAESLSRAEYRAHGKYSAVTISRRFDGWNKALVKARLPVKYPLNIPLRELMKNIKQLWDTLGRCPGKDDMIRPLSKYSTSPYVTRFGTWHNALKAFSEYLRSGKTAGGERTAPVKYKKTRTRRDVNLALRYAILKRDNYKCRLCGSSPATDPKVKLHVDHIKPWVKGGETTESNLQTLCQKCNLGKGKDFD